MITLADNDSITQMVGVIEFGKAPELRQVGTGSIVKGKDKPIVVTAAHCIYDFKNKKYHEDIYFTPKGCDRKFKPRAVAIPKDFIDNTYLEFDTCFLVMEDEFYDLDISNDSALNVAFNLERGLEYEIYGYLGDSNELITTKDVAIQDIYKHSTMQGIPCVEKGGLSGGPWMTELNGQMVQNSISVLSFKAAKGVMWGPYWGECIESAFMVANGIQTSNPLVEFYYFE